MRYFLELIRFGMKSRYTIKYLYTLIVGALIFVGKNRDATNGVDASELLMVFIFVVDGLFNCLFLIKKLVFVPIVIELRE